jgi:hypothetical protein
MWAWVFYTPRDRPSRQGKGGRTGIASGRIVDVKVVLAAGQQATAASSRSVCRSKEEN